MPPKPDRLPQRKPWSLRPCFDLGLVATGLLLFFFVLPHELSGDGAVRYAAVAQFIEEGRLSDMPYSFVGPLFSVPFYLLGKWHRSPQWWCARFNVLVLASGLFIVHRLMREQLDRTLLSRFCVLLTAASMFPNHLRGYYGEVFTAVTVAVGLLMVAMGRPLWGWAAVVLGAVNTPASMGGLALACVRQTFESKRWRHLLPLVVAGGLILVESWIRRGHPLAAGYEGNAGFRTILPYSGREGFSYPLFFGVLSILLSFGKGLVFFAPGLVLSLVERGDLLKRRTVAAHGL
jgi:hypothetical protein